MAYGKIRVDTLTWDNSGTPTDVTIATLPTAANPTFTGAISLNAQGDFRYYDSDSSNYVGFQAPGTVSSNVLWTLPGADGSAGQQLTTDGSGTLSWSAAVNVQAASLTGTTMAANVVTSSLTTVGTLTSLTIDGDVTFTGASSNGLWDKSANAFVADVTGNLTGNVTGNASGSSGSCTGNAATATEATNITVTANNSTDETVYPLFADGNTGTQGAETDTGLTYNPSSGLLTSTGFVGNVTGNCSGSSGSCTGNAATSDGVDTTSSNNDATHYLTMVNSSSTEAGSTIRKYTSISCNPNSGNVSVTGSVTDSKGNLRSVPTRNETSAYTLVAADAGKCITADNGVTVNTSVFSAGDVVTIINSATSDKTITQGSGMTMRNVGDDGNTGNVSVKKYAMCTLIFTSHDVCFFSTTAKA